MSSDAAFNRDSVKRSHLDLTCAKLDEQQANPDNISCPAVVQRKSPLRIWRLLQRLIPFLPRGIERHRIARRFTKTLSRNPSKSFRAHIGSPRLLKKVSLAENKRKNLYSQPLRFNKQSIEKFPIYYRNTAFATSCFNKTVFYYACWHTVVI